MSNCPKTKHFRAKKEHSERQNRSENPLQHYKRFLELKLSTPVFEEELFRIKMLCEFLDVITERECAHIDTSTYDDYLQRLASLAPPHIDRSQKSRDIDYAIPAEIVRDEHNSVEQNGLEKETQRKYQLHRKEAIQQCTDGLTESTNPGKQWANRSDDTSSIQSYHHCNSAIVSSTRHPVKAFSPWTDKDRRTVHNVDMRETIDQGNVDSGKQHADLYTQSHQLVLACAGNDIDANTKLDMSSITAAAHIHTRR